MGIVLVVKLTLVPLLIAGITWAGRRFGPGVAGWLSAFPVIAGPILLLLALEQGTQFAAEAAVGTLSAVLAILAFGLGYAWAASKRSWHTSLLAGFTAYGMAVAMLKQTSPALLFASLAVVVALLVAPRLYPAPIATDTKAKPSAQDIWFRMAVGALLVWLVTYFSALLGPRLSGIFAMFPVLASVLAAFSHRQQGAAFAIELLRGTVFGYYAFSAFCAVLALALPRLDLTAAFLLALTCALVIQAISRFALQRQTRGV
jgi:uncharacterized membrane protein (GlpM family)